MSITSHKSLESLAIYQRVKEDEKMMMGMSLMYSLFRPKEVHSVLNQNQIQQQPQIEAPVQNTNIQLQITAPAMPQAKASTSNATIKPAPTIEPHALDPMNKNILPLESALAPYTPPQVKDTNQEVDFDIIELLNDVEEDEYLMQAATQIERQNTQFDNNSVKTSTSTNTTTSKPVIKKTNPFEGTFQGCRIGSIGNIHIHIHKH